MIQKYKLDNHVIYHGDAISILEESIADSSIDLIFSDPPYNIGKKLGALMISGRRMKNTPNGALSGLICV